jgi:hypothetical protein
MISYAPIDDEPFMRPRRRRLPGPAQSVASKRESTECNYIVLFFVVGVLLLAVSDNLRRT